MINTQYLQYVRQQLIVATADLSGATKGQLTAFAENAQFAATVRSRGTEESSRSGHRAHGKPIKPANPRAAVRAKGSAIALVMPVEYSTASWRRALLSLEEHQKAWLLWELQRQYPLGAPGDDHQVGVGAIQREAGRCAHCKRKTVDRLRQLIWLAAQNTKQEITGRGHHYAPASMVGIKPDNWCHNYSDYWQIMMDIYQELDSHALLSVSRSRSQQKATFSQQGIAKVN